MIRRLLLIPFIGLALTVPAAAQAQAYPAKPVRIVTEFIAGAGGDISMRLIAGPMSAAMGQPIIIENSAGAGGIVATQQVARAAADGYTLLAITPTVPVVRVHLAKDNSFDALKELTPISTMIEPSIVLVANASLGISNLQELIDLAKKSPGKLSYGTNGVGSGPHLGTERIQMLAGISMLHVPYKAMQQAMIDAATGQIPMSWALAGPIAAQVKAAKVKVITLLNEKRYPVWPEVATIRETLPGYGAVPMWTGLFGPAGLPQPVVRRLSSELQKSLQDAEVRAKLASGGTQATGNTPEEFTAMIRAQIDLVGRIVKSAGIQPSD
ncbi:MAG: hypothetical protein A3H35_20050 [Betaproteobacteria bacterium RIFCSPLOWO2_02_FULL_62_17]|nr:MAG: hypothetical protein A3H35_20050 [Betaproteobacteria bacterium RIFCSPLOWO2_02_FULL_62_17]